MNSKELLESFDRVAEAPNAVPLLRQFIRNLAMRGRLVEQDASDEPSSELLLRIQNGTQQRRANGSFADPKNSIHISLDELPFSVPSHWSWARLIEISDVSYGFAFESNRFNSSKKGMPLIRIRDISSSDTEAYFDGPYDPQYVVEVGDYLVGMDGNFNVRKWNGVRGLLNQRVVRLRNWRESLAADFLAFPLQAILDHLHISTSQTTVKHLSAKQLNGVYLPIPPLAEQYRIVAKVDELMCVCDQLEAAQQEREGHRDRLASASLKCLNPPGTNATLEAQREHARFYLSQLFRLTTRSGHIKELRQTIYGLAVRGLLVAQEGAEEAAAAFLKSIRLEKAKLVIAGTIPKEKTAPVNAVLPFPLPENWQAVRLGEVCNFVTSGSRGWAAFYAESGPKFLRAQNIRFGRLRLDDIACVNPPAKSEGSRTQVQMGDLLIVITGAGVTNPALLESDLGEAYVSQHVALVRPTKTVLSKWLLLCLMSGPGGRDELVERAYGAGKPGLNLDNIRSLNTPIPPLAEQHRIVAKVEELIDLCDQIETLLNSIQTNSRALLENLLDKTLGVVRASSKLIAVATTSAKSSELHKMGKESRFMTTSPASTVDQLLECIDELGGATTPERLLMQTGLSEDVEAFYDLIRAARDSGKLTAPLGSGEEIRRLVDAD